MTKMKINTTNLKATIKSSLLLVAVSVISLTGHNVWAGSDSASMQKQNSSAMESYLKAQANLPVIERSDWVNVKTDVTPAAVGDGVADDTAAIQAALSKIEDKSTRVVYFPPGTYRITNTLSVSKIYGGGLFGHGRATVLLWDGASASEPVNTKHGASIQLAPRMFHSNGFSRCMYFGLTFDGAGKAAVGVDHDSLSLYETRVRYQYCAFRNFVDSGIRVGAPGFTTPSAEMMFFDCLFENNGRGVSFLEFNDYDNAFSRCIFRNNGSGIYCHRGNVYVRDCHFENSKEQDILLPPHSHSIRRCTSTGSRAFVKWSQKGGHPLLLAVQDCHVSNWTDPKGAIQLNNRGPSLIFDSVFSNPAILSSPAINLVNEKHEDQILMTANLKGENVNTILNPGVNGTVHEIPRQDPGMLITAHAEARWNHRPDLPTKIFDAKRDFGAKGDNRTDDTAAIQAAIDAARKHGKGAMAYLPATEYAVSRTLNLDKGDYFFGGAVAWHTRLEWRGGNDGVILAASNADNLRVTQVRLNVPKKTPATGLLATATRKGQLTIDGLVSGGGWQPEFRGTVLQDLPAGFKVRAPHLDGDIHILNCGDANILLDTWLMGYDGPLVLSGGTGNGFIGINAAAGCHGKPDMTINDSSSIVVGDYYTEQTHQALKANGKPGNRRGRITLSYAKLEGKPDKITLNNYQGQVFLSRANACYIPTTFAGNSNGKTDLLLLGMSFNPVAPEYDLKGITLYQLGCNLWNHKDKSLNVMLPNKEGAGMNKAINAALDHFRELSEVNLEVK